MQFATGRIHLANAQATIEVVAVRIAVRRTTATGAGIAAYDGRTRAHALALLNRQVRAELIPLVAAARRRDFADGFTALAVRAPG